MYIDLTPLHRNIVNDIDISNKYTIPKEYIYEESVLEVKDINVNGKISLRDDEDYIECTINGKILIEDSISLEPIDYDINIEYDDYIDDIYKKNENTLDIFLFLWENIVLEVPLQFTKVEDLSKFHGDGWRLICEEDRVKEENPFTDLLKDFEEE